LLWEKIFPGVYDDVGYCVKRSTGSGYVVCGAKIGECLWHDVCLIKIDADGDSA
jgi:hypothetical protein